MAINWRGSDTDRDAAAFRALVRRLREFMDGRAHNYADGVIVEGHIGERQGSIQLISVNGEDHLLISLACGRSPSLHILPIASKRSPGLDPYTEPEHSISRLHSTWTDDITATAGLLSNEDNLRTLRQFCLHRSSTVKIGNGTIEFHGPLSSSDDYFEAIRSVALKLAGIAAAFERERVHLPHSHARDILKVAVAVICILIFSAVVAPSVRTMFSERKVELKVTHFEPSQLGGWRGVEPTDFAPDDLEWFTDRHQAPARVTYADFDGSKQESGTIQFLRKYNVEDGPFRVLCYDHGKELSDDVYPTVAFALKVSTRELRKVKWNGAAPAQILDGDALLVVESRKEAGSGTVYIFEGGKIGKYHPVDFRFL